MPRGDFRIGLPHPFTASVYRIRLPRPFTHPFTASFTASVYQYRLHASALCMTIPEQSVDVPMREAGAQSRCAKPMRQADAQCRWGMRTLRALGIGVTHRLYVLVWHLSFTHRFYASV